MLWWRGESAIDNPKLAVLSISSHFVERYLAVAADKEGRSSRY